MNTAVIRCKTVRTLVGFLGLVLANASLTGQSLADWPMLDKDLRGSRAGDGARFAVSLDGYAEKWSIPGAEIVLTGDVQGNSKLEVVARTAAGIVIYDSTGNLVRTISITDANLGCLADVNRDGKKEIFVGKRESDNNLSVYVFKGDGTQIKRIAVPHGAYDCGIEPRFVEDIDGDGKLEVVSYVGTGYSIQRRGIEVSNYTTGTRKWATDSGPFCRDTRLADINGDGQKELLHGSGGPANWRTGADGTTDYTSYTYCYAASSGTRTWLRTFGCCGFHDAMVFLPDLDGNGRPDVVAEPTVHGWDMADYGVGSLHVLNPANGSTTASVDFGHRTDSGIFTDLDGDGKDDMIISYHDASTAYVKAFGGTTLTPKGTYSRAGGWMFCYAASDLNGDGKPEILAVFSNGSGAGNDKLLILNSTLTQVLREIDLGEADIRNVIVSDLNRDGTVEVAAVTTSRVRVLSANADSRARLVSALTQLSVAMENYQVASLDVAADAFAYTALEIRKDFTLKKIFTDLGLDLLAGDLLPRTAGKFFSKPSEEAVKWAVKEWPQYIKSKVAIKGASLATEAMNVWMNAPELGGIDPNWNEEQVRQYIRTFLGTKLNNELALIQDRLRVLTASIPDPLPPGFPVDSVVANLVQLKGDVERLTPARGSGLEDASYWAIPGFADFDQYANYNPALLGLSGKVAVDHKNVEAALLKIDKAVTAIRRRTCIAWNVGKGVLHVLSLITGPGAIPSAPGIEGVYWSGVSLCKVSETANTGFDIFAKNFAVFQLGHDLSSIESDTEYVAGIFDSVADAVTAVVNLPLTASTVLTVGNLNADDVEVGLFDIWGSATTAIQITNGDASKTGKARALVEVHRRSGGSYNDLVYAQTAETSVPAAGQRGLSFTYSVPAGFLLGTEKYLMECNIISTAGKFYRSAYFRACNPVACWWDDTITPVASGRLSESQSVSGTFSVGPNTQVAEVALNYPGSDFDLHIWDSQGRHVGIDYVTGEVELGIPGATYSGPDSKPEIVRLPGVAAQELWYEVRAIQVDDEEDFQVFLTEEKAHPATLIATPATISHQIRRGSTENWTFTLSEVGGQIDATGVQATISDLAGASRTISASDISLLDIPAQISAGGSAGVGIQLAVQDCFPLGVYSGQMSVTWSSGTIQIPVAIEVIPRSDDADGDCVPDAQDQCPNTPPGAIVSPNGCSIDQLVPCAGPATGGKWKTHGDYVSAVAREAEKFLAAGLITQVQKDAIVAAAAKSPCGGRK